MNNLPKVSLEDTLYLIQLMRETALSQGEKARASRLTPVESEIRGLVSTSRQAQPTPTAAPASGTIPAMGTTPAPASGIMGQSDFKKLLEVTQTRNSGAQPVSSTNAALERNRMIQAMAAANMSEIDIARQFGVTRDEVSLVLSAQTKGAAK
jgi:hypothetical protein